MLERLDKLFNEFGPMDRKILAICFLCFTVTSDFVSGLLPTFILYVLCVVWCSNYVGGRFATILALIAAFFRIESLESIAEGYRALSYLNIAATFLILDAVVQYKNKLLTGLNSLVAHVESQSLTDSLTAIPNRRAFIARVTMALAHSHRYGEPFSLAYIDIDNFKQVNDSLGHAAGDQLLSVVASAIRSELRGDDMVARLGGDEFGIIFAHAQQGIHRHVDRVKQTLDNHCPHGRAYQAIGFSIGVVHYDGTVHATTDELICYADRLMYEVKKGSKNSVRFGMFTQQDLLNE